MGQTTFAVASELVGHSYANLVLVSPSSTIKEDDKKEDSKQTAKICSVCARLAMCLMDKGWTMPLPDGVTLQGKRKTW